MWEVVIKSLRRKEAAQKNTDMRSLVFVCRRNGAFSPQLTPFFLLELSASVRRESFARFRRKMSECDKRAVKNARRWASDCTKGRRQGVCDETFPLRRRNIRAIIQSGQKNEEKDG